jgi:intracellular septation protein A
VVRAAARTTEQPEVELKTPTFLGVFRAGAPGFLREGFIPLGAFYAGLKAGDLALGIVASVVASVLIYAYERRAGREGLLVRVSLAFVVVQSAIGLIANSTTVYLAQPVLIAAAWGLAFLVSVTLGRPLAGELASVWYPFPREFRATPEFRHVFGIVSLVWGVYFLARSGLRLWILLHGSLENFLAINIVTGAPVMLAILAWSIRYSIRALSD